MLFKWFIWILRTTFVYTFSGHSNWRWLIGCNIFFYFKLRRMNKTCAFIQSTRVFERSNDRPKYCSEFYQLNYRNWSSKLWNHMTCYWRPCLCTCLYFLHLNRYKNNGAVFCYSLCSVFLISSSFFSHSSAPWIAVV